MAHTVSFFMTPDDELAFLRFIERFHLEVYPVRIPPNWKPFPATSDKVDQFPADAAYLAASELGNVLVDKVKRGPDRGQWRVDEVRSPVIFFERCVRNEESELVSGKLWAELDITAQTGRKDAAPDKFRRMYLEIDGWIKKTFRKGDPKDFWVGPKAAREFKEGLVLRDSEHRGGTVRPHS
ncbi:MAG: hypothetical protein ACT4TC_02240 [Myxococcaceae bacterium]